MIALLDSLFCRIRSWPFLLRLTLFTRILLAAGFIPTGMVKLLGRRFTTISYDTPIGRFFEEMYLTGGYWQFLGASQLLAGLLLLVPRFAHLGAAMFLPIMVNIFVITISLGFHGTPIVTGLMLLAVIFLCMWDFHRFRPMLTLTPLEKPVAEHRLDRWEFAGFVVFAVSLIGFLLMTRDLAERGFAAACVVIGVLAGLFTLGRFCWLWRARRLASV